MFTHTSFKTNLDWIQSGFNLASFPGSLGREPGTKARFNPHCSRAFVSLVPRPETARRKGPGFHCLRMRLTESRIHKGEGANDVFVVTWSRV